MSTANVSQSDTVPAGFTCRALYSHADFRMAEAAQRVGWELRDETQIIPLHVLLTAQMNGGLVAGAFDPAGRMVGFLFGFLGLQRDGRLKHCSHLMCVEPALRSQGIGTALKRFQSEYVRTQGIALITWTYDPLEGANARLNIGQLRAFSRTFYPNLYGAFDDALNAGLPTDRLEVEWWINTPRVTDPPPAARTLASWIESGAVLLNSTHSHGPIRQPSDHDALTFDAQSDYPALLLEIPAAYQTIKRESMASAEAWRQHSGQWLTALFAAGWVITDFSGERGPAAADARSFYVLTRPAPSELIESGPL